MAEIMLFDIALKKAMGLCAGREMCQFDLKQKLMSWGVKEEDAINILTTLTRERFIDEERYAIAFSRDKFKYNKWGKVKIAGGLRMKRIPQELVTRGLDSIDEGEYVDLLKNIIAKHQKTVTAKNEYDLKGKILRHCLSKGFESQLVYDILNDF